MWVAHMLFKRKRDLREHKETLQREVRHGEVIYLRGLKLLTPARLCCSAQPLCPSPFFASSSSFLTIVNAFTTVSSLEEYDCIMKDATKKCKMSVCLCVSVHGCVYGKAEPIIW